MVAISNSKPDVPRLYIYKESDSGDTETMIVDMHTAAEVCKRDKWKLSPYEFLPEEKRSQTAEIVANGVCQDLNMSLNLHLEKDKQEIAKFSKRFLEFEPNPKMSRKAMVRKIEQVARKQGKWFEDHFDVVRQEEVSE